jgi:hypothetical protein
MGKAIMKDEDRDALIEAWDKYIDVVDDLNFSELIPQTIIMPDMEFEKLHDLLDDSDEYWFNNPLIKPGVKVEMYNKKIKEVRLEELNKIIQKLEKEADDVSKGIFDAEAVLRRFIQKVREEAKTLDA